MKFSVYRLSTCILVVQAVMLIFLMTINYNNYKSFSKSSAEIIFTSSVPNVNTNNNLYFNITMTTSSSLKDVQKNAKALGNASIPAVGSCRHQILPIAALEEKWQPVDDRHLAYVFSAFWIERNRKVVIVAATSQQRHQYYCLMWFVNDGKLSVEEVLARDRVLPEGHKKRYAASLLQCFMRSQTPPDYVSVTTRHCGTPTNTLKVQWYPDPGHFQRQFTVCLTPLNYHYNNTYELVEWFELNKVLGAEKFVVYNCSISQNVDHILKLYSGWGLVDVVQWRLPMKVKTTQNEHNNEEIHYYGQLAALQDCLYRNRQVSEFVVNIDLDEFIIPQSENISTWSQLLSQLDHNAGAYIFLNTFFRKEWENEVTNPRFKKYVDRFKLTTLGKVNREEKVYPVRQRSKYFARTAHAGLLMIHNVLGLPTRNKAETVPESVGLLHHYRHWHNEFELNSNRVFNDIIPSKYGEMLVNNLEEAWSKIRK